MLRNDRSDRDDKNDNSPRLLSALGSITKASTAIEIMRISHAGKVVSIIINNLDGNYRQNRDFCCQQPPPLTLWANHGMMIVDTVEVIARFCV